MPKEIENEDGTKETVYTQQELDDIKNQEIETYKNEHPDKTEEITKLQKELEDTKELLSKKDDKDKNFSELRTKVKELETQLDQKVQKGINENTATMAIDSLSDGDDELKKKIKFHFETSLKAVEPKTPEEMSKKVQDAYMLATGTKPSGAGIPGFIIGSGSGNQPKFKQENKSDLKPEVKDLAKKMGLSEEDCKKFDKQDFSTTK